MRLTQRLLWTVLLAVIGAAPGDPGAAPIHPADPGYVVAELPGGAARAQARFADELAQSRRDPAGAAALAGALLQQARASQQPQLYGRAESVLAPWVAKPHAPTALLLLQADILQQRHEFSHATGILDTILAREPQDRQARLMRANTALVTGQFERARPDCAWLLARGDPWTGSVCLAQVLGATGQLSQARALVTPLTAATPSTTAPDALSWALQVAADLASRAGAPADAAPCLSRALTLTPESDPARLALADVLIAQGRRSEAQALLDIPRASVGILLRRWELTQAPPALAELQERLAVSAQRGERTHLREEARLALDLSADPAHALALARDNFALQRETEDVRLLARAASQARDPGALTQLRQWLIQTRYQDALVDHVLNGGAS